MTNAKKNKDAAEDVDKAHADVDTKAVKKASSDAGSDDATKRSKRAADARNRSDRSDASEHLKELESVAKFKEPEKRDKKPEPVRRREPRASAPSPQRSEGLESVVSPSETSEKPKSEENTGSSESDERGLERRVRSVRPEDVQKMRTLAERVYHQGWNRLSGEEQQAFLYHSRFLEYLSEQERTRPDIQSTMYRFVGAQGKSLGLSSTYSTRDISLLTDRFFDQISTPFNRPDMYRAPANTDYFKGNERTR